MPNWNTLTNKQGLIVWGGEQSTNYGIVVSSAPVFDRPVKRANVYNVQGRNGSVLFQDGSFDDVTRTYKVWIAYTCLVYNFFYIDVQVFAMGIPSRITLSYGFKFSIYKNSHGTIYRSCFYA